MRVTLYTIKNDNKTVMKSAARIAGPVECKVKGSCTVLRPEIVLASASVPNWTQANYMYIDTFGRYYYIDGDRTVVSTAGEVTICGSVDPLYSWASHILQLTCVVIRQEFISSPYFQDGALAKRVNRKYVYKQIGSLPNAQTNVLTVDGGGRDE